MIRPAADTLLYLSRQDVGAIAREMDWVAVLRHVFTLHGSGHTILPEEACLRWENDGEHLRSLAMPAYVGAPFDTPGTKVINGNPSNIHRGLPRADGLLLLFDPVTGRLTCVMHGADVSALRTAGVTMLAAELLGPSPLETVALIGAGVLGRAHLALVAAYLKSVKRVLVHDLLPERAGELQAESAAITGGAALDVSVVPSAEAAVREADLVVPATTTTTPYIAYEWLKPGCLVVNVSLDDVDPDVVMRCDLLVVDDWDLVRADDRRLIGRMFRAGQVVGPGEAKRSPNCRAVDAQLAEIVMGTRQGRRADSDIILVNPFGLAIEDVGIGAQVMQAAVRRGIGTHLPR